MPSLRILFIGAILCLTLLTPSASANPAAGKTQFVQAAESDFDRFTKNPTTVERDWMNSRYWRMRAYAPYFDSRLSWFKDAWAYQDLYAIYPNDPIASQHPEWILRDAQGDPLYIPFGCGGGKCPQYAGDVGNPAFRAYWIQQARLKMAAGYRGLFVDDVNMELRVGDGSGREVAPRDPRTGATMSLATWRRYVAEFTESIRSAIPDKEIVHNAIWYSGYSDPSVQRELRAADVIELERGVNDSGITGGGGRYGYETFLNRVDWIHAQGKGVILDGRPDNATEREYSLATYFLTSNGRDGIGDARGGRPDSFWRGYSTDLGAPAGARYNWQGLLRRDFAGGFVLVNQPGRPARTVDVGAAARDMNGAPRPRVTLRGGEGAVFGGAGARGRSATRTLVIPHPNPKVRSKARSSRRGAPRRRMRRAVLVRGRVKAAAGGKVKLRLAKRVNGRWVRVRSKRASVSRSGRFRKLFRGMPRARYRVSAKYLGSKAAAPSKSRAKRFRVRH